jgi:hypothetical protein
LEGLPISSHSGAAVSWWKYLQLDTGYFFGLLF